MDVNTEEAVSKDHLEKGKQDSLPEDHLEDKRLTLAGIPLGLEYNWSWVMFSSFSLIVTVANACNILSYLRILE